LPGWAVITANRYQHVLPSMDERTADAVADLILGGRLDAESSAVSSGEITRYG
jgi:hypothetical protein